MLFSYVSKVQLSPPAHFITQLYIFNDHSFLIIDLNISNKSTTLRYFPKNISEPSSHQFTLPYIIRQSACIKDKQLILINTQKSQIITANFEHEQKITYYQLKQLENLMPKIMTFSHGATFIILDQSASDKDLSTIFYFKYPAELLYSQQIQTKRRRLCKINQDAELGIFFPFFEEYFTIQIINLDRRDSEVFAIPLSATKTVRDIRRFRRDKLIILLSDCKSICVYDTFTNSVSSLIQITSFEYSFSQTIDASGNIIFNWIPMQDYIVVVVRNTSSSTQDRVYLCSYSGSLINCHPTKIANARNIKALPNCRQYSENEYVYKGAKQIQIKQWELPEAKEIETFLVTEGLCLSQQLLPWIVNSINYEN